MDGKVALMERCLAQLAECPSAEEKIKVLRVLGSTALKMAEEIEIVQQLKEIDYAQLVQ